MTHAEIDRAPLPSSAALGFDALHVPANRRSAESAWYDAFSIANERFVVSIGNIAGGEAKAEALMLAVREIFRAGAATVDSGTLLGAADAALRRSTASAGAFATAIVGVVDCAGQTFTYMSAGHPPPFIRYADGVVAALPAGGLPVGLAELDHPPVQVVVDLHHAASVMLYSSALVQTTKNVGDDLDRLQRFLADERATSCASPMSWLAHRMLDDRAHDDVALLTLTFPCCLPLAGADAISTGERARWSVSWSFNATGAASNGVRRAFLAYLGSKDNGGKPADLAAAELIFGELLGNVVRHAPGLVEITLDWNEEFPVLHVRDNGPGFRSRRARERLPVDDLSESGRGLFIINAFATKFSVRNRNGRGTHACATLPLA